MRMGLSSMRLDRENKRCLGVCAGVADWLEVPATLVRIIFIICVISWPTLIVGYFLLYFCLDKEITPDKLRDYFNDAKTADHFKHLHYRQPIYNNSRNTNQVQQMDYRKPICTSARSKRIDGICSCIADDLEVRAFSVRAVTLCSLFIFGPFTFWAYIICIFVFDPDPHTTDADSYARKMQRRQRRAERRARRHARKNRVRMSYANEEFTADMKDMKDKVKAAVSRMHDTTAKTDESTAAASQYSRKECTEIYSSLETRLREIEAFMTSKRFRLHCEFNRI